jgi:acyl carrier protein phosphodiesterase
MQGWRVSIIERAKREYMKENMWLGKTYSIRNIEDVKNRSCERTEDLEEIETSVYTMEKW